MITKLRQDNHLFVFHNGDMIYKKWYPGGRSVVFDPYGYPWSPQEMDRHHRTERRDNSPGNTGGDDG